MAGNEALCLYAASVGNLILICYPLSICVVVDGYCFLVTSSHALYLRKLRSFILQIAYLGSLCYAWSISSLIKKCSYSSNEFECSSNKTMCRYCIYTIIKHNSVIWYIYIPLFLYYYLTVMYYTVHNDQANGSTYLYLLFVVFLLCLDSRRH
jgi:hypothetical protein